jgi:integrase/recombinase XerD
MSGRPDLRVIPGGSDLALATARDDVLDPFVYQARCVGSWVTSMVARGFSTTTIEGDNATLDRFLALAGKPVWELTAADIDRMVAALHARGAGAVTRRDYVTTFKQFFEFLQARYAADIAVRFGVRLVSPIDRFHAGRHVADPAATARTPPTPLRMEQFFAFIRARMELARKWVPWARDYALLRLLYHCGLRCAEAAALEVADLHFDRGPFGKVHVRFGKAAKGSGPRPRWVPMLDNAGLILHWYLDEVRVRFRQPGDALFCDEGGGPLATGTIRNRVRYFMRVEGRPTHERFSPHDLRHACATRNYERGVDLVAIQQLLGHWHIGTTMGYVTPSSTFVEDAYRRALSSTLADLTADSAAGS